MKQHAMFEALPVVRSFAFALLLGACGASAGGSTTTTGPAPSDGGTTHAPDTHASCGALCANAQRANCGPFNPQCVEACDRLVAQVPTRCAAPMNAYLACAASAHVACASDGAEVQGCDAQDTAVSACVGDDTPPPPNDAGTPAPTDRCLPDAAIPADIAARLCTSTPGTPVPHDCPGGAPSSECVPVPSGESNVFCCAR